MSILLSAPQGNGDWLPIRPRYSLISDKLKQAGYTNHFVGKWYESLKHAYNCRLHLYTIHLSHRAQRFFLTTPSPFRSRRHLGDISRRSWPKNRGFDTSRGFHFSGIGDTFDWKLSHWGIPSVCSVDAGYDLIYEDVMPAGGTKSAAYPVNSRDSGNTWAGKTYIHSGEDNRPPNIVDDFFELYKSRAAGDATADADLKAYSTARDNTNEVSKTIREETVRHIESKDSNSAPFFMYVAAMAMRGYGEQSDEQRQNVFDHMESDIDSCDVFYPDLQTYPDDVGMKELKRVLELDGQNWNTISAGFYHEFCPTNNVKNEIHNGVSTAVDSKRRNSRFASNSYSTNIDVLVNATIDALYRKNLWDNTLILLTFDNGGWPNGQAFNWPLRGKCPLLTRTSALHTLCCMCLLHL